MNITQSPEDVERFLQALRDRNEAGQAHRFESPGFHVAGLLRSIYKRSGLGKNYSDEIDDDALKRFEMGYAWEDLLATYYINRDGSKPTSVGTLEMDGIVFTPDGYDGEEVDEYKATWKSQKKHDVWEEWTWLNQIKAYCYALGVRKANLRVLYVAGNYAPPLPIVEMYRIEPTDAEVAETWNMLLREKERLEAEGKTRI